MQLRCLTELHLHLQLILTNLLAVALSAQSHFIHGDDASKRSIKFLIGLLQNPPQFRYGFCCIVRVSRVTNQLAQGVLCND